MASPDPGRTRHYGEFYDVVPAPADDDRPVLFVLGNCQAEALRILLDDPGAPYRPVRIPPVHELEQADVAHLHRLAARAAVIVAQPVRDDYRSLPVGTEQVLAQQALGARHVIFPVIRWAALYPYQAIVRADGVGDPPGVPYHDLRTLLLAAGRSARRAAGAEPIRQLAEASLAELRAREARHGSIAVSDLLRPAGAAAAHTINHPGNPVLTELAQRVAAVLGWQPGTLDPGRELLRSVYTPLEPHVLAALGLDDQARADWRVQDRPVADETIAAQQLDWYAVHPEVVAAGLTRHAETLRMLDL